MKAFLLAAGYGTRLRPLTNTIPKCMVPMSCRPLLAWWMDLFERHGITDVLVNTHYLPELVREFIRKYNARSTNTRLVEFHEKQLLGSGGTVLANKNFVGNDDFLICYADNLTNTNLSSLTDFHKEKGALLTMALFHTNKPKECGIAALDEYGCIIKFEEKPINPNSNLANAGIYVASKEIFNYFPNQEFIDFGKDVLPKLIGQMYGMEIKDYLLDIGNFDSYVKAQKEWQQ